jgi:hypothetical protein
MLVIALLGAPLPLGLMAWFVVIAPEFIGMLQDFGGTLPRATRLLIVMVSHGWGPAMFLLYLLALPAPFLFRSNVVRDFAMVVVVIAGLLAVMASTACLYLPLFQVSQQMRP